MSDINANIVVSPIDLNVTVSTNQLTFTPEAISLNLYAGGVGTSNSLTANIANVHIFGGVNGYVLQTDGTGNLTWTAQTGNGGSGNGTPGGSNTQVQYNDSGSFGGNVGFTFNEITGFLNVPGNVTAPYFVGNASYATFAAAATTAATVTTNAQPNITSLGTLTSLAVTGNSNTGNIYTSGLSGNISGANVITANTFIGNLTGNLSGTFTGNLLAGNITSNANVNFTTASNVSLGAVGNIKITGGTANYVLKTDGTGNLSWVVQSSASGSNISNGNSNVNIATSNGNVTITANGTTSLTVSNSNVTARQFISNVATGTAPFVVTSTTTVSNLSVSTAGTVTTNAQPNITSVGVLSSLNVGNATGNLIVSNATGNWNITFNGNGNIYANTGFYVGNRIYANVIATNQLVYANLPGFQGGARAFISDANTRTFDSVVGGGGANYMPVWNDGTNWRIG